jgi:hypothetical protein
MRKFCFCLVSVFLIFSFYFPSASLAVEKLAVMDLEAKYGVEKGLAEGLSVVIRDTIQNFGDYEVISKRDVEAVAERTAIRQKLGCDDIECLINIGKALGTKFMVAGAISKFGNTYNVSLRLIETIGKDPGVRKRVSKNCKCAEDELISTSVTVAAILMGESGTQTESPTIEPYAKLSLRKEPKKMLGKDTVRTMLKKHDFSDSEWNPNGSYVNDFVDNGDGTVTDKATGLMWQRVGSPGPRTHKEATRYIVSLNYKRFLGYSDWRMPTIEELASIITRNAESGLHINPLFAKKQELCWSSDSGFMEDEYLKDVWIANFAKGRVELHMLEDIAYMRGKYDDTFYVRGVRSAR